MPRRTSNIWNYFELINTDGKKTTKCNFCRQYLGNNATKLKKHCLSACKLCPENVKMTIQYETKREVPITAAISLSAPCHVPSTSSQSLIPLIPVSFNTEENSSSASFSFSQESTQHSSNVISPKQKKEIELCLARAIYAPGYITRYFRIQFLAKSKRCTKSFIQFLRDTSLAILC
ncbi:unnamed protein product [Diatraea saccharalis]|uniref:BED-type domain-containing protein n=1 Tax=Diatraea saccharalis TaxID=40085 RepID=A0A9N9R8T9_9NEOP|nr:unnamed protein product [Diatraea saccharalis]